MVFSMDTGWQSRKVFFDGKSDLRSESKNRSKDRSKLEVARPAYLVYFPGEPYFYGVPGLREDIGTALAGCLGCGGWEALQLTCTTHWPTQNSLCKSGVCMWLKQDVSKCTEEKELNLTLAACKSKCLSGHLFQLLNISFFCVLASQDALEVMRVSHWLSQWGGRRASWDGWVTKVQKRDQWVRHRAFVDHEM